jgi:hypothetical protein
MNRKSIIGIAIVAILIIAIAGGYVLWQGGYLNQPSASPSPSPSPSQSPTPTLPAPSETPTPTPTPETQARDDTMSYIGTNHVETAQFMTSLSWTGGREDTGLLGVEKYMYNSAGWTVAIQYPVVLNPTYTIYARYISPVSQITPEQVIFYWQGTWQNGTITETSYTNAQLSTQEQVRDAVMNYIRGNHAETVLYAQNLTWTGGRTTPSGILGSETYTYLSTGWNVTMRYPVVPNAIYTITADYSVPSTEPSIPVRVIWEGTWQNGTITETNYTFAQ